MAARSSADRARWFGILRACLAVAFAVSTVLYSIWAIVVLRPAVPVELGFNAPTFDDGRHALLVHDVSRLSPAEEAGLRAGDRIVAIDGQPLRDGNSQPAAWSRHQAGDRVRLTVERDGLPGPLVLTGVFRRATGRGGFVATEVQSWYRVPFVLVGLTVLFLRLDDRNVWILALLLVALTTTTDASPSSATGLAGALLPLANPYRALLLAFVGPLFYWFFATFPSRSPIDRRAPWFKWLGLGLGLSLGLPGMATGKLQLPGRLPASLGDPGSDFIPFWSEFVLLALGLVSLTLTFFATEDRQTIRKIRVIFWGTTIALVPPLARLAVENGFAVTAPDWLRTINSALLFLFPLSFAYAVVKHRVLEIPVLLKRSARYLLVQRGFALSLSMITIALTLLFAFSFAARLHPLVDVTGPSGIILGAVFGTLVLWSGLRVHRDVSERIDRAFFRSAYDARVILEDLAQQTRTARTREELAALLDRHLSDALKPTSLVVYLAVPDPAGGEGGRLKAIAGAAPGGLEAIPPGTPLLDMLAARTQPWDVTGRADRPMGADRWLAPLNADCLVPITGRDRRVAGLIVLGPRLSEEPYSGEDKRLLSSVASQAATALDTMRFAEELAARLERERRVAHEMEIAREVQRRLLPQAAPSLRTATCAAECIQARSVGGDFYDFLDLGDNRVGFVLADVSGKGVHAALLSASIQAHLRSQAALAPLDPVQLLGRLNDVVWKSTAAQHYATLFFAVYDDCTRHLVYANCGHNPPFLVRADGGVERLAVTAPVVGLFEQWECRAGETRVRPGDMLAVFSDGITEAMHGDEEFGEARLLELLRDDMARPARDVLAAVLGAVQRFSAGEQSDDLTLLVVKAPDFFS